MSTRPSERGHGVSRRLLLLTLLAVTGFAAGCGFPPSRVEFIEKMAKENRKIARSTVAFRNAVKPVTTGQPADAVKVRSAYNDMEKTLKEVQSDMSGQLLPPSSNSAKDFMKAYNAYLDGQQDILDNYLLKIVQEIEAKPDADGHPTPAEQQAYVNDVLGRVTAKESETWGPLKAAEKTYADEHNYQVMDLAGYIANQKAGK